MKKLSGCARRGAALLPAVLWVPVRVLVQDLQCFDAARPVDDEEQHVASDDPCDGEEGEGGSRHRLHLGVLEQLRQRLRWRVWQRSGTASGAARRATHRCSARRRNRMTRTHQEHVCEVLLHKYHHACGHTAQSEHACSRHRASQDTDTVLQGKASSALRTDTCEVHEVAPEHEVDRDHVVLRRQRGTR